MSQDERLQERIAEDLDANFEELVRTYQDRLYSYALRLMGRAEDAEEVAQDAFVKAYRALATYPGERIRALALKPWLYRITLNAARNRFRGKKLRTVSLDHPRNPHGGDEGAEPGWEIADTNAEAPDRRYEKAQVRLGIAALMAGLPERYRAVCSCATSKG